MLSTRTRYFPLGTFFGTTKLTSFLSRHQETQTSVSYRLLLLFCTGGRFVVPGRVFFLRYAGHVFSSPPSGPLPSTALILPALNQTAPSGTLAM